MSGLCAYKRVSLLLMWVEPTRHYQLGFENNFWDTWHFPFRIIILGLNLVIFKSNAIENTGWRVTRNGRYCTCYARTTMVFWQKILWEPFMMEACLSRWPRTKQQLHLEKEPSICQLISWLLLNYTFKLEIAISQISMKLLCKGLGRKA